MGRRKKLSAGKKKKRTLVKVIERESEGEVVQPYRIMEALIDEHHAHLRKAKVALAWRFGWKEDRDGRLTLGQARKASDLDREMHRFDFVILLNHEAWNAAEFTEPQMRALLDHELCHCEVVKEQGEPKTDDQGRTCWRIRRHDIEEFVEIVARHGLWKRDVERFAKVAMEKLNAPLLTRRKPAPPAADEDPPREPWRSVTLDDLGILDQPAELLTAAKLTTLGAIEDYLIAGLKLNEIKGIGPEIEKQIYEARARYFEEHKHQPHQADAA